MADYHTQVLEIDGMHCDACVRRVSLALGAVPGTRIHTVEVGRATVMAEPSSEQELRKAVADAGFAVTEVRAQG